jgi:hypothetical protein
LHERETSTHQHHRSHPSRDCLDARKLAKQHDRSLNGEIVRASREYTEKHREKQT